MWGGNGKKGGTRVHKRRHDGIYLCHPLEKMGGTVPWVAHLKISRFLIK